MIKKILVALDPDSDTPLATQYAIDIAKRFDAEVTGLAVIDMGSIKDSARGGGIGSMYYAEKLRAKLTTDARLKARELMNAFDEAMEDSGVRFVETVEEGVPFMRIVEDMKYHDLLVIGRDPHFFYSHPKQETDTLARTVKNTIGPSLVVGTEFKPVERILIAFDGSNAAARAVRRLVHLRPFGEEVKVEVIHVHKDEPKESELVLQLEQAYLRAHGIRAQTASLQGDSPESEIVSYATQYGADIVVAGAHSVSKLREVAFGSTTAALLKDCPVPLFIDN